MNWDDLEEYYSDRGGIYITIPLHRALIYFSVDLVEILDSNNNNYALLKFSKSNNAIIMQFREIPQLFALKIHKRRKTWSLAARSFFKHFNIIKTGRFPIEKITIDELGECWVIYLDKK